MAFPGKHILNSRTGQELLFIQTSQSTQGYLLEMESRFRPNSVEPPPHYHPHQIEDFTVLSGVITVRMNGKIHQLKTGDQLHIPINTVHSIWNASDAPAAVNWKVRPALATEHMLETYTCLANEGKTDETGIPSLLQVAMVGRKFNREFRPARPPWMITNLIFTLLSPFARAAGFRPTYPHHLD